MDPEYAESCSQEASSFPNTELMQFLPYLLPFCYIFVASSSHFHYNQN